MNRGIKGMLEFPCDVERLDNGNTLITDAGDETGAGSEIIEVDSLGQIVWIYSGDLIFAHSAKRLANGNTLISDTTNNRIIEVTHEGGIVFSSDNWGNGTGRLSDQSHLNYPNDAHQLEDGSFIITDRNNNRCIIVDRDGNVKWCYDREIKHPHNCDMLKNGNILIVDSDGKKIIEVNMDKEIIWMYGNGNEDLLDWPRDADRLTNGNTLITDSRNSRIIEVNSDGKIVWSYDAKYFANFYDADMLPDGNVLISDQQHHRVLEVDFNGNIIWSFCNYRNNNIIHPKIKNGSFKSRDEYGFPEGWILYNRFSEGGGRIIWDETEMPRPCPGILSDREGAVCLQQVVAVKPGQIYKLAVKVKASGLQSGSFSYLQLAFIDKYGGLIEDASKAPKGNLFTGTTDWIEDSFSAKAPECATAAEIRAVVCGKGLAWFKDLMFLT